MSSPPAFRSETRDASIRVNAGDAAGFAGLQAGWDELLRRSDADPLFMSWPWLWTWWSVFGAGDSSLRLYEAYGNDERRLGIAPCWLSREWIKRVIPVQRLQLIGNRWRNDTVAITEYSDFITDRACHEQVVHALLEHIEATDDWDELVIVAMRSDSPTCGIMLNFATARGWLVRVTDRTSAHRIALADGFDAFLGRLSSATRRQLFNKRGRLQDQTVTRTIATDMDAVERAFDTLNRFHVQRWGRPAYEGARREFQRRICEQALRAAALRLETLYVDDQPLSVVFDLHTAMTEYNLQSGFEGSHPPGLSPGLMHLGCAIESAAHAGRRWFDLLAGAGRSTDYKRALADEHIQLTTMQLVRSRWLARLYRSWDKVQGQSFPADAA